MLLWDPDYMTQQTFGYAHIYVIEEEMFELFREKLAWPELLPGDLLRFDPDGTRSLIRCSLADGTEKLESVRNTLLSNLRDLRSAVIDSGLTSS